VSDHVYHLHKTGKILVLEMLFSNATTCPLWTLWSPSWLSAKCNRLLRLGCP
jgi:hypothetical protein